MRVLAKIAFRNLREHKTKTLIIGSLIAFGMMILVIGNSALDTATAGIESNYTENYTGHVIVAAAGVESPALTPDGAMQSTDEATPSIPDYQRFARRSAGLCAIRLIGATPTIGFVGFREFFVPPRLQLLYGLLPRYWGQGIAFEATRRMCDFAFLELGFPRIEAAMDPPNARSIALAERLGLSRFDVPGERPDVTLFYEIDRDAWISRHP